MWMAAASYRGACMDKIRIRDLHLNCIIGIGEEERKHRQEVLINITLHVDLNDACKSDRIEDTVNYHEIVENVGSLVEESSFYLVERLAESIAGACLKEPKVRRVEVSLEKPGALRSARSAGVELVRDRTEQEGQTRGDR